MEVRGRSVIMFVMLCLIVESIHASVGATVVTVNLVPKIQNGLGSAHVVTIP